jgi:hypothetical protein
MTSKTQIKTRTNRPRLAITALCAGLAIGFMPGVVDQAQAQWAIGDGTALDRNLRKGDTRRLPASRNYAAEATFRNAVITGNAPQGLRFRGEVDYTSPYEFRSSVGSEVSDAFRRDSLYSGLAGYGIRGTDALQFQFAMTTGNTPPPSLTGTLTTHRFGGGVYFRSATGPKPIGTVVSNTETIRRTDTVDPFLDERGKGLWTLRSTSAYTSSRSYQPAALKLFGTPSGDALALTASSLRGIEIVSLGNTADLLDNTPASIARQRARAGAGREFYPALPDGVAPDATGLGNQTGLDLNSELARRYDAYANWRGGGRPADTADNWRKSVQTLRDYLSAPLPELPDTGPAQTFKPVMPEGLSPGDIDLLRNAPGQYESLVLRDPEVVDAYGQHMRAGQKLMGESRYFDAEERFTRALAFAPGDEFASASRINAQIGAGLFVSAAINLRSQMRDHPETISLRLSEAMLPKAQRLQTIATRLRSNVADERSRIRADSALLIAYIGFQSKNETMAREGVDAFERVAPSDRLGPIIRKLWLSDRGGDP